MRSNLTLDNFTMDDGLDYLRRNLEHIQAKTYEKKYPGIIYPTVCPVSFEAGAMANAITYETMDQRAKARLLAVGSDTMPMADISKGHFTMPVEHGGLGYQYTLQELREAQFLGVPLDQRRADAVRQGVEELTQDICFLGSPTHNLPGFLNNADIPSAGAGFGTWSGATADEIIADVNQGLNLVWSRSKTSHLAGTVLLPPTAFTKLATTMVGTEHNRSLLDVLQTSNLYYARTGMPLEIVPVNSLEGLGAASTGRLVIYEKNPDNLTMHVPMPLQFVAPQAVDLNVRVPGEFRISGVEIRYPGAFQFIDDI
jgi:hypothetical protein